MVGGASSISEVAAESVSATSGAIIPSTGITPADFAKEFMISYGVNKAIGYSKKNRRKNKNRRLKIKR